MKLGLVTIVILSSLSAMAAINPTDMINEGTKILQSGNKLVQNNIFGIKKAQQELTSVAKKLEAAPATNPQLKESFKSLSLEEYETNITQNIDAMNWAISSSQISHAYVTGLTERDMCSMKQFFKFEDSDKFIDLATRGVTHFTSGTISPQKIIDSTYIETLEYIANNAPIKVKRDTNRFGSAVSEFNRRSKTIRMSIAYDWMIVGIDHILGPEISNPVELIQKER